MIKKDIIKNLYHKYPRRASSINLLDLSTLFDKVGITHNIIVDDTDNSLVIGSMAENPIFHRLPLRNIHAIEAIEDWLTIILHSSILFLHQHTPTVRIHLR